jgi:hypothetical protein
MRSMALREGDWLPTFDIQKSIETHVSGQYCSMVILIHTTYTMVNTWSFDGNSRTQMRPSFGAPVFHHDDEGVLLADANRR